MVHTLSSSCSPSFILVTRFVLVVPKRQRFQLEVITHAHIRAHERTRAPLTEQPPKSNNKQQTTKQMTEAQPLFSAANSGVWYHRIEDVVAKMKDTRTGLDISDRKWRFRSYKNCFVGMCACVNACVKMKSACVSGSVFPTHTHEHLCIQHTM